MDWMRYRKIYFSISGLVIGLGLTSLILWGLRPGVDFKGGTLAEYKFGSEISTEDIKKDLAAGGFEISTIQNTGNSKYLFRLGVINLEDRQKIFDFLKNSAGKSEVEELRFESVGPSIGPELIKKTFYALSIAAGAILLWVAIQFKSIKFGSAAILAMFHDSLVLLGSFSLMGHFFGAEIDFLFVTAMLTILSFSVHDTIVVYDRIRESQRKFGGNIYELANKAVSETMVRSLNNSFTIVFMLVALILLGGSTIKWFATALLIGTISGTYSSPFVAVPILVVWDQLQSKFRKVK